MQLIRQQLERNPFMLTKVRQILGKLFLSSASFFWFSCDNANSEFPVNPPNIANQNSSSSCLTNENTSSSSYFNENLSSNERLSSNALPSSSAMEYSSSATSSSSSNNASSSSSTIPASSSSEKAPISCKPHTSSSSVKREAPQKASFDIEQTLSIMSHDTTGLIGQCVSAEQYCAIQMASDSRDFHMYSLDEKSRNHARFFVNDDVDSLLASPRGTSFSDEKRNCISNLKYKDNDFEGNILLYGVPPWSECEGKEPVQIDENYIKALLKIDSLFHVEYRKIFEETNKKAAECDALE